MKHYPRFLFFSGAFEADVENVHRWIKASGSPRSMFESRPEKNIWALGELRSHIIDGLCCLVFLSGQLALLRKQGEQILREIVLLDQMQRSTSAMGNNTTTQLWSTLHTNKPSIMWVFIDVSKLIHPFFVWCNERGTDQWIHTLWRCNLCIDLKRWLWVVGISVSIEFNNFDASAVAT